MMIRVMVMMMMTVMMLLMRVVMRWRSCRSQRMRQMSVLMTGVMVMLVTMVAEKVMVMRRMTMKMMLIPMLLLTVISFEKQCCPHTVRHVYGECNCPVFSPENPSCNTAAWQSHVKSAEKVQAAK